MLLEESVYLGTDNATVLALRRDLKALTHIDNALDDIDSATHTHPAIVRCTVYVLPIIGDESDAMVIADSDSMPDLFDLTDPFVLQFSLTVLPIKPGRHITRIYVYEADSQNGTMWGEIMLVVHAALGVS